MSEPLSCHDHGNCDLCDRLERERAEDREAILALRASARAQCYTQAQHDVTAAIEQRHIIAINRAVQDGIDHARAQEAK